NETPAKQGFESERTQPVRSAPWRRSASESDEEGGSGRTPLSRTGHAATRSGLARRLRKEGAQERADVAPVALRTGDACLVVLADRHRDGHFTLTGLAVVLIERHPASPLAGEVISGEVCSSGCSLPYAFPLYAHRDHRASRAAACDSSASGSASGERADAIAGGGAGSQRGAIGFGLAALGAGADGGDDFLRRGQALSR